VCGKKSNTRVEGHYNNNNNNNNNILVVFLLTRLSIVPLTRTVYSTLSNKNNNIMLYYVILYYCCCYIIRVGCHIMIAFYFFIETTFYSHCGHWPCVSIKSGSQLRHLSGCVAFIVF